MRTLRFVAFVALVTTLIPTRGAAQQIAAANPRLEVLTRMGDYYWIVATASDGSRTGGWVAAAIVDRIDVRTFRPVPPAAPPTAPPLVMSTVPNDFDGITLALQNMREKVNAAAATLEGFPDAAALRARVQQIDQASALVRQLATDQSFGATRAPAAAAPPPPPAAVATPTPVVAAAAQQPPAPSGRPHIRNGWWFNGGLGLGSIGCDGCFGRDGGATVDLSVGKALGEKWLLGVGNSSFGTSTIFGSLSVGTLDFRARFYPSRPHGFFLTGGVGLGALCIESACETGAGALFGIGWDLRVGRNVSLTPFYSGFAMQSDLVNANVGQLGLGITIH